MFFIIFTILLIFALVAIFRDDHDPTYDRKGSRTSADVPPEVTMAKQNLSNQPNQPNQPKPIESLFPRDKTAVHSPLPRMQEHIGPKQTLSWTFLYSLDYYENFPREVFHTIISGMYYYCTPDDVGPVNGIVRPEPDNPHDPKAQVVIRADGKKLGYLPRHVLNQYEAFSEGAVACPFAGNISVDRQGRFGAYIRIALPQSREFVKETLTKFME